MEQDEDVQYLGPMPAGEAYVFFVFLERELEPEEDPGSSQQQRFFLQEIVACGLDVGLPEGEP